MKKTLLFTLLFGVTLSFQSCEVKYDTGDTKTEENTSTEKESSSNEETTKGANQNFSVVNNTGMTLTAVYISPAESDNWGDDVIPTDMVGDGEKFDFTFTGVSPDQCSWDIQFTGEDGVDYYLREVDLCRTSTITLSRTE